MHASSQKSKQSFQMSGHSKGRMERLGGEGGGWFVAGCRAKQSGARSEKNVFNEFMYVQLYNYSSHRIIK